MCRALAPVDRMPVGVGNRDVRATHDSFTDGNSGGATDGGPAESAIAADLQDGVRQESSQYARPVHARQVGPDGGPELGIRSDPDGRAGQAPDDRKAVK